MKPTIPGFSNVSHCRINCLTNRLGIAIKSNRHNTGRHRGYAIIATVLIQPVGQQFKLIAINRRQERFFQNNFKSVGFSHA